MNGPDEYDQLVSRGFKPYSRQHIALYETIACLLSETESSIIEIGGGIGCGYSILKEKNCFNEYLFIEPSKKCCDYVKENLSIHPLNQDFMSVEISKIYDYSLCIEVIEHIGDIDLIRWFKKTMANTKIASFISTPDKRTDSHGVYTKEYVYDCMINAGYSSVVKIESQLPHTLFIGEV